MMKKSFLIISMLLATTAASAQEILNFYVNDETKRDIVTFTSRAPLETVVGKTGEIVGYVKIDPGDIKGSANAKFEVDLASLNTGIGLRDNHMRQQYLETEKFPKAVFLLTSIKESNQNNLEDGKPIEMIALGEFSVHGVSKDIEVPLTVTFIKESEATKARHPGDLLHIVANFDVYLSEHNIRRPQFVILKLDDRQKIYVDLFASTGLPQVELTQK